MSHASDPIGQLVTTVDQLITELTANLSGPSTGPSAGMDLKIYPGGDVMQKLFDSGSFCWTGYYLAPAPYRKDISWMGTREMLVEQGWGLAPVYLGQQQNFKKVAAWDDASAHPEGPVAAAEAQADIDAVDAATLSLAEHFPTNSVIFLDVEPTAASDTAAYAAYVTRWFTALPTALSTTSGMPSYQPGLYVNWNNTNLKNFQLPPGAPTWYAHAIASTTRKRDAPEKGKIIKYTKVADVLDAKGWPIIRSPDDVQRPPKPRMTCQMWQWGLDVVFAKDKCGYTLTDYDGNVLKVPTDPTAGLDYDTSWVTDPSVNGGGTGVINSVAAVDLGSAQPTVVGGADAKFIVTLAQPAARPGGVSVQVSGGGHTSSTVVPPGGTQAGVSVPTNPVPVLTPVDFTATTAWWPHSRTFADRDGDPGPEQPTVTVSITP